MPNYSNFSIHAPTGVPQHVVVTPNQYSDQGRTISYPSRFSAYVNKLSEADGTQYVTEQRKVSDLRGNRLYLWHRPLTNALGVAAPIVVGGGGSPVIDAGATNAKAGYIVFSFLPTSDFTVSYSAVPDCITAWNLNTLQDDVMEIQKTIGINSNTGVIGLKNLAYATFDTPEDANFSGVAPRAVYLSHLGRDIFVGSSSETAIINEVGDKHKILIGQTGDTVVIQGTGIHFLNTGVTGNKILLGNKVHDSITFIGSLSGAGQFTIGGPEWANLGTVDSDSRGYSGHIFEPTTGLTQSYYDGSMLRVHGDVAVMGNVLSRGAMTIVNTTGETSIVLGDWTVTNDLIVNGKSYLRGGIETTDVNVSQFLNVDGAISFGNAYGPTTVDGLDPSVVAESYDLIAKRRLKNSIIDAPINQREVPPILNVTTPYYSINNSGLVGDVFTITGTVNTIFTSGSHAGILKVNLSADIVTGSFTGFISWTGRGQAAPLSGTRRGVWSPGLLDPGFLEVRALGINNNEPYPVYGYHITQADNHGIGQIDLFVPTEISRIPDFANAKVLMYNPGSAPYDFITAQGGASPTFAVSGIGTSPLEISFDNQCKRFIGPSSNISLLAALSNSAGEATSRPPTGVAYIFAQANQPSESMTFTARAVPMRRRDEVAIGEVVATSGGGSWTISEVACYRPNGIYDSAWMPMVASCKQGLNSGRYIPEASDTGRFPNSPFKYYFHHNLGPVQDLHHLSTELYLASSPKSTDGLGGGSVSFMHTGTYTGYNQTHTTLYSFYGQDHAGPPGMLGPIHGAFAKQTLSPKRTWGGLDREFELTGYRDANIFYIDSRIIGVQFYSGIFEQLQTGTVGNSNEENHYKYLRLVVRREV